MCVCVCRPVSATEFKSITTIDNESIHPQTGNTVYNARLIFNYLERMNNSRPADHLDIHATPVLLTD